MEVSRAFSLNRPQFTVCSKPYFSFRGFIYGRLDYFMRMHSFRLYIALGLALASSIIYAQTAPTSSGFGANGVFVQAVASKSAVADATNSNVISMQQFRVTNGTAPPKYYDRAVAYTRAQFGGKIKPFLKAYGPSILIQTGITLGIGLFLDYVTGDIYPQPATPAQTCSQGYYQDSLTNKRFCSLSASEKYIKEALLNQLRVTPDYMLPAISAWVNVYSDANQHQFEYNITYQIAGSMTRYPMCGGGGNCTAIVISHPNNNSYNAPAVPVAFPYPLDAIGDQWLKDAPDKANVPFVNPNTGAVIRDAVNAQAEKDLYNEIAPSLGKAASTATPVTPLAPELQPSPSYDTQTSPDTGTNALDIAFPVFCTWASYVCTAIDWMQDTGTEPVNSDYKFSDSVTVTEISEQNYSSGIGGGTCPSPKSFNVLGTSLEYSFEPICDLAEVARIFVLLFAYLSSVYIVMGVRK